MCRSAAQLVLLAAAGALLAGATGATSAAAPERSGPRVLRVDWSGEHRLQSGSVRYRVTRIEVSGRAWAVTARLTNGTSRPLRVSRSEPPSFRECRTGLIGFYRTSAGYGNTKLTAASFQPRLPASLAPGQVWQGVFRGRGPLPPRTLLYVCFGYFLEPRQSDGFSIVTDQGFRT